MHSFPWNNCQLESGGFFFPTILHLFGENMASHRSNQMLLTAVVETPMWKLLLSFIEQKWGYSKQPGTPRQGKNNVHSFVLKPLPFRLQQKAALASVSSSWSRSSGRLFFLSDFKRMSFWGMSPVSRHRPLRPYCSRSLNIWVSWWRMMCFF